MSSQFIRRPNRMVVLNEVLSQSDPCLVLMSFLDSAAAAVKKFTPKKGVNLVGIDDYEIPGEGYYLIGNFDDAETAKKFAATIHDNDDKTVLIGPDGVLPNQ